MEKQSIFLNKPQFDDSFKGIFGIQAYKEEDVEDAKVVMRDMIEKAMHSF